MSIMLGWLTIGEWLENLCQTVKKDTIRDGSGEIKETLKTNFFVEKKMRITVVKWKYLLTC